MAKTTTDLSTLKINLLSQAQYDAEKSGGTLEANELYLTPMTDVLDLFYPVGSYYETSDSTFDPNVAWGGNWSLETAGKFHISAGTGYTIGGTGGSKDAVVVSHTHKTGGEYVYYGSGNQTGTVLLWSSSPASETSSTGVSGTDKNLPPYVAVNRWHRTA